MNKYILLSTILGLFLFITQSYSQEQFSVNNIDPKLKKDARSVIRLDETELEISNEGKAVIKKRFVITILNKNGLKDATFVDSYDNHSRISIFKAIVYDENGKIKRRIPRSDFLDISAVGEATIYDDSRVKVIDPKTQEYPFTVEYVHTKTLKNTLNLPSWTPIKDYEVSSEFSQLIVKTPKEIKLRYFENMINDIVEKSEKKQNLIYQWQIKNTPAVKHESYCLPISNIVPMVLFTLDSFEIGNEKGASDSWESLSSWLYKLNEGRDSLSEESILKVKNLTNELDDNRSKIKVLYEYMQQNTRYVSVQVGLSGWQPFPADFVDRLAYGDCKALSNYMKTLLKYAGIESYYSVINAGKNATPVIKDFPSNQFNHVILCVPNKGDTIWLECTSQTNAFGYLGTFTDNRYALLVKEEGGKLVKTPKLESSNNFLKTNATVKINSDNICEVNINREYCGSFYEKAKWFMLSDNADQQKKIYNFIKVPNFTISDFNFIEKISDSPKIEENTNITLDSYFTNLGSNVLFKGNLLSKITYTPKSRTARTADIYVQRDVSTIDSITYELPEGLVLNNIPEDIIIQTQFGNFKSEVSLNENRIIYTRNFILNSGTYSKEIFSDFVDFYEQMKKADNMNMVLSKE